MNNIKIPILLVIALIFSACGPTIYTASNFESARAKVKTVAILPFNVSIEIKRLPEGTSADAIKESEKKTGYAMQSSAYKWFLNRMDDYTAKFQDIDKTNSLLNKADLSYDQIIKEDKGELCKILGVDAVISGSTNLSKPMSEGAAVALGVLFGAWGPTNSATTTLSIHDAQSDLLWKFDHELKGSIGSSPENLTNALLKKASKKYPFSKNQ